MASSAAFVILSWVGPILGVIGFIITPGLTHIRPWLAERFNKNKEDRIDRVLSNNYNAMKPVDLVKEYINLKDNYRFDWRSKIRKRRKELTIAMRIQIDQEHYTQG